MSCCALRGDFSAAGRHYNRVITLSEGGDGGLPAFHKEARLALARLGANRMEATATAATR
jgi:hypothetical protein